MRISAISGVCKDARAVLGLFGCSYVLSEGGPPWPREWSDSLFADPKFRKWLEGLGVAGDIGEPMMGGVGRAYQIGDYIVKFTPDKKEADAAAVLVGHGSEHAAGVFGVTKAGEFRDPRRSTGVYTLWAIVMEKLNADVGKRMRIAANAVYNYLDKYYGFIEDPEYVAKRAFLMLKKKYRVPSMLGIVRKVVDAIYDVQVKTGVLSQDPHGGNIAFKGRSPAFFDFGRSKIDWDNPATGGARIGSLE